MSHWYQKSPSEVLQELDTSDQGLSHQIARRRFESKGPNELVESGGRGPWQILADQLRGAMVLLLVIAAGVSMWLGEYTDVIVIAAIIILNGALGFFQEYRAEKAMAALKQLSVPLVRVLRDGKVEELSARDLVPGDVVLLETGNIVPADGRLLKTHSLKVQEAALTGESEAIDKQTDSIDEPDLALGDRNNLAFMGTLVTFGRGQMVVTETGMDTELGKIAKMIQTVKSEPTPLQQRLAQLGRSLAIGAVLIVAVVFVLGLLQGRDVEMMLLTAISLAVAVVPEGLPAVATVALALGARRMLRRKALIRKLPAVETLGSVTVICSDKTGTLTENVMTVTILDFASDTLVLSEPLREGEPTTIGQDPPETLNDRPVLALLLVGGGICNDATLHEDRTHRGSWRTVGDPTEGALVVAAARFGLQKQDLEKAMPRVAELPFDSERKRMTTVHRLKDPTHFPDNASALLKIPAFQPDRFVLFTKGAVDSLLTVSSHVAKQGGHSVTLDDELRDQITSTNNRLAGRGMRVLGVAYRVLDDLPSDLNVDTLERNFTFLGMAGMIDPPRPEVQAAVSRCRSAGIRPIMITGDHPLTARYIAQELGMTESDQVVTGKDLANMSSSQIQTAAESSNVFARVSPEHKLQIIQALKHKGHVVAMTGDGVNDAPALKQADIGVAMGITGTDVSKEAAKMVLLDDNFATIVNAVEEGRNIYDNVRKFIRYTLTSNFGEICVMLLPSMLAFTPLMGLNDMPIPLLPLQILWINLVTDGLPGLALALEPPEPDTMLRPPHPPEEHVFARGLGREILWVGFLMGLVSFGAGYLYWEFVTQSATGIKGQDAYWRTIIFTVLTLSQMGHAIAVRSPTYSTFQIGLFSNKPLLAAVGLTFALQMAVTYVPFLQTIFQTVPLTLLDMIICLLLSTIVFWTLEASKWVKRRRRGHGGRPVE